MLTPIPFYRSSRETFTTAYRFPSANASVFSFEYPWSNPTNAYADDANTATSGSQSWANGERTDRHQWTGFGFTTGDVPSGATITGVDFEAEFVITGGTFRIFMYAETSSGSTGGNIVNLAPGTHVVAPSDFGTTPEALWGVLEAGYGVDDTDVRNAGYGWAFFVREQEASNPFTGEVELNYVKSRILGEI